MTAPAAVIAGGGPSALGEEHIMFTSVMVAHDLTMAGDRALPVVRAHTGLSGVSGELLRIASPLVGDTGGLRHTSSAGEPWPTVGPPTPARSLRAAFLPAPPLSTSMVARTCCW